jgi:hypothetical protein
MPVVKVPQLSASAKQVKQFYLVSPDGPGEDLFFECLNFDSLSVLSFLYANFSSLAWITKINNEDFYEGISVAGTHGGVFSFTTDSFSFSPDGDFNSLENPSVVTTSVTYTATDGNERRTANIFVEVYALPYVAPEVVADVSTVIADTTVSGNVFTNDVLGSTDYLSVISVNNNVEVGTPVIGSVGGVFTLAANGDLGHLIQAKIF